ncbi:GAF domain-containing protein [Siccirubricoccus phaeus]|uniref:GAF domain-containing protein n=1 Tax=Siccirubricoccus phaeus TaxID=2595053 RepID=UPI0011F12CDC|nr:GAF domain-containing protein [Siccirubricoccus phaeus]
MSRLDPIPALSRLTLQLAEADQVEAGYLALGAAAEEMFSPLLFSIMLHDAEAGWNLRVHSSQPEIYPPGGRKPVQDTPWTRRLFQQGKPWLSVDVAAIRATFADHVLIEALGCGCAMNLPVRWRGRTLGTLNVLAEEGRYTPGDLAPGRVLAALALPVLQEARRQHG